MTNIDRFDELIDDWARGRLGAEERAEFDAILAANGDLRAEAEDHRRVLAIVASEKPAKAPAGLVAAAMARARAEAAHAPAAKVVEVSPSASAGGSRVLWFAAAAALAVMAGGYAVLRPSGEKSVTTINGANMAAASTAKREELSELRDDHAARAYDPTGKTISQGDVYRNQTLGAPQGAAGIAMSQPPSLAGGDAEKDAYYESARPKLFALDAIAPATQEMPQLAATLPDIDTDSDVQVFFAQTDVVVGDAGNVSQAAPATIADYDVDGDGDVDGVIDGNALNFEIAAAPAAAWDSAPASEAVAQPAQAAQAASTIATEIAEAKEELEVALAAPTPAAPREVERPRVESRVAPADRPAGAVSNRAASTADAISADAFGGEAPAESAFRRAVDEPRTKVRDITPTPMADAPASIAAASPKASSEPQMAAVAVAPIDDAVVTFFERQTQRAGGNVVAFADPKVFAADFPNQQALDSFLRMLEVVPVSVDRSETQVAMQPASATPVVARGLSASKDDKNGARYSFNDGGRMFGIDARKDEKQPAKAFKANGFAAGKKEQQSQDKAARQVPAAPKTQMLDLDDYIVETVRGGDNGRLMLLIRRKDASVETHQVPARVQQQ